MKILTYVIIKRVKTDIQSITKEINNKNKLQNKINEIINELNQ